MDKQIWSLYLSYCDLASVLPVSCNQGVSLLVVAVFVLLYLLLEVEIMQESLLPS